MAPGRVLLARARLVLAWEGAFALFWPAIAWAGGCLALFLTGWLPELPDGLHLTLLAFLLAGFGWLSISALRRCHWPQRAVALRRIEAESGLSHRPFAALEDRLTDGDAAARALWQAHLDRVQRQIGKLRTGWPRTGLAARDPFGLRAPILLCLLLAILHAGDAALDRLRRSLWPFTSVAAPVVLDAWIAPPAYTAIAPIYLAAAASDSALRVPIGSRLTAQTTGSRTAPVLRQGGDAAVFTKTGDRHFRLERQVSAGTALAIEVDGRTIAAWPMVILPDTPPEATIFAPQVNQRQHVRFGFQVKDDYGIQSAILTLRRPDEAVDGALRAAPIELPLTIVAGRRLAEGGPYHDLTGHIWAGLPVQAQIVASDGADQQGESGWIDLTLPERSFRHPVARALIALRKRLILDPGEIDRHRAALTRIAGQPQLYGQDAGVFLTLIVAALRLGALPPQIAAEQAQALLWSLAVKLEDGESGQREAELRQAEQALRAALADKASPELLERLIADMQAALDRYLQTPGKRLPSQGQARAIGRDDLQQILEAAGILANMGQSAQAQALLDRLRQIMDSLAIADHDAGGEEAGGEEAAIRQILQTLQNLSRRQRELMARGAMPGAVSSQQELYRQLGELMQRLDAGGLASKALVQGGQAMRRASEALRRGQMRAAEAAQSQALDRIGQAARSLIEQMGREQGWQRGQQGAGGAAVRDPLGRNPAQGAVPGGDIVIPDNNQLQRMRDIFEELRRRAAEPGRPAIERDYLDRLLRPF